MTSFSIAKYLTKYIASSQHLLQRTVYSRVNFVAYGVRSRRMHNPQCFFVTVRAGTAYRKI